MLLLYNLFIVLVILDIWITYLVLEKGHTELNPIVKWLHVNFGLKGHIIFSSITSILFLLSEPSFCRFVLVCLVLILAIGNNLYVCRVKKCFN